MGPHLFEIFKKKVRGWGGARVRFFTQNGGVSKIGEAVLKKESMKISDS